MESTLRPTRTRYGVIVFAVMLGIIHYIDRVCISKARPFIQQDLGFDDTQMGYVFSAFTLAYALFEIPGGWLGDKWGPRRVLLRVVMFWSVFTAATGYAWNLASMIVCRFLFGAGEAGGFPNIAKMFSVWLPQREHGVAQGSHHPPAGDRCRRRGRPLSVAREGQPAHRRTPHGGGAGERGREEGALTKPLCARHPPAVLHSSRPARSA